MFRFLGLLTLIFIILKLTETIVWSWWWVFCPLWMPVVGIILIPLILLLFIAPLYGIYKLFNRN